jgi:hypothetical protein
MTNESEQTINKQTIKAIGNARKRITRGKFLTAQEAKRRLEKI